jgi:hypothetical protein
MIAVWVYGSSILLDFWLAGLQEMLLKCKYFLEIHTISEKDWQLSPWFSEKDEQLSLLFSEDVVQQH